MSLIFRASLILTAALCLFAGQPDATKVQCTKAGLVIRVDMIGGIISFKNPQGYIAQIKTDDQTVITQAARGQAEPVRIKRSGIEYGDLICAAVAEDGNLATHVFAVPSAVVEQRRHEFLAQWQRGSIFGVIESIDADRRGMVVVPSSSAAGSTGVPVRLGPNVRYRKFPAAAKAVTEAVPFPVSELRAGEQVYVWGVRDKGGSSVQAGIVAIGGPRAIAGTISEVHPLTSAVSVRELESGQDLDVTLSVSQLYRTAPMMTSPTKIKTPAGVPLVSVDFGDLKPGDSVLVIGSNSGTGSKMAGVILISSFGAFGVAPDDPSGQLTWFFK